MIIAPRDRVSRVRGWASLKDAEEDISQVLEVADQEDRVQAEEMVEDQDSMELWLVLLEDLKEPLLRGLI